MTLILTDLLYYDLDKEALKLMFVSFAQSNNI